MGDISSHFRIRVVKQEQGQRRSSPTFDKLLMFKILILQRYFNLSDDQTEFQIKDRLSFMDFLNLELSDKIPDAKTIWLFKERLGKNGLTEKLFDLFTETLNAKGIIAKEGSMVDASFVDVPKQRNNREDNAIIKKGAVPISLAKNKLAQKDTDARWITKYNERHFGYKELHKRRQKNQAHKQLFRYQCQYSRFSRTRKFSQRNR